MFELKDLSFTDKKVLLRADFNVPLKDGQISDESRITKTLPTLNYIIDKKPKQLIIISHLGRPENQYNPAFSLRPVHQRLQELLKKEIVFDISPRVNTIQLLPDDQIVMLENLRFDKVEEDNDQNFAKKLAGFADIYVFEAFSVAHRSHASVIGVPKYLPSCMGFLMKKEIEFLAQKTQNPERPFLAIIGGGKEDKADVLFNLMEKVDGLILGGVMANTFLKASGIDIGKSRYSEEFIAQAQELLKMHPNKINLPVDFILGKDLSADTETRVAGIKDIIGDWLILDIGPYTISGYMKIINQAKTIVWAGPLGVFEIDNFKRGTWDIARHLAGKNITKIVCGGDSASAVQMFKLEHKMTHVSTGGGASLELLAGKELPGIKALQENYSIFNK